MISQIWGVCTTWCVGHRFGRSSTKVVDVIVGLARQRRDEREGLDVTEHTSRAYNM